MDNTHLNPRTLQRTQQLCEQLGYEVLVQDFSQVPVEICVERDAARDSDQQVGKQVILRMAQQAGLIEPDASSNAVQLRQLPRAELKPGLPWCCIVDLDGTLAENVSRSFWDEQRVSEDLPRTHVLRTIKALQAQQVLLVFLSGRSTKCEDLTHQWLQQQCDFQAGSYQLHMRPAGDRRRDSVVKRELFDQHVKHQFSVLAVFDDRAQVVRELWADLQLPVFRCGVIDQDEF